jgi:hypothetical protein
MERWDKRRHVIEGLLSFFVYGYGYDGRQIGHYAQAYRT